MENIVFMDQLTCRTCLINVEVSNSLNDCVEFETKIELKEILWKVCSVVIDWNKTLQLTRICNDCTDKLLKAYEFQAQVVASERRLNEYFADVKKAEVREDNRMNNRIDSETIEVDSPIIDDGFALEEDDAIILDSITFKTEANSPLKNESAAEPSFNSKTQDNGSPHIEEPAQQIGFSEDKLENQTENEIVRCSSKQKTKQTKSKDIKGKKAKKPKRGKIGKKGPNHNEEPTFQCETCARKFYSPETLERHQKCHLGSGSFQCSHCARSFTKKDNLLRHMIVHKISEDVSQKHKYKHGLCPHCGESFSASSLIIHIRRHTGEKPYKCDICGKGYPRLQDMTIHKRLHTGEKPHVCETCGKAFSRTNSLARHIRVHTGERPYKCNQCDKSFAQSNDLNLHIRRHTGEKPYRCNVCNLSFINGSTLKIHKKVESHFEEDEKGPDRYEKIRVTNPHRACWTRKGEEKKVTVNDIKDSVATMPKDEVDEEEEDFKLLT